VQDAAIKSFRFVVYLPHHHSSNKTISERSPKKFLKSSIIFLETCNYHIPSFTGLCLCK
jgi:hypothetical protein